MKKGKISTFIISLLGFIIQAVITPYFLRDYYQLLVLNSLNMFIVAITCFMYNKILKNNFKKE